MKWAIAQTSATATARCVVYSWLSIDDDPARARHRLMPAIDRWLELDLFPHADAPPALPIPHRQVTQRDWRSPTRSASAETP